MIYRGYAYRLGDDINTDVIAPSIYSDDEGLMRKHAFEAIIKDFYKTTENKKTIIVASKNFGCGSSRETAVTAIKSLGVEIVVAGSFARIFYRNAINGALPPVVFEDYTGISSDDELEIDIEKGILKNITKGTGGSFTPISSNALKIIKSGGLLALLKKELIEEVFR
ncbi:MAG: 3-isopropylmalate dehydratase small subunit [Candidatus Thermoplasmatota archaeon]|jgi:3-isopropylmalate/(R)-2-methylmalate dehydratase small subunit|nr:3-isopropylmalate dehydratase small subunit [Candidatus Thermoplasmatota archaeon]MCL5963234.1 3-isopropylmalate dehydratase small subunit [Candidatus Thermoplasmatota archaeon]